MGYSTDVTDKEWEIIKPLLPTKKKTRPPLWTKRQILDGGGVRHYECEQELLKDGSRQRDIWG
ncbi:MAG: transposase, partial [Nostoc sp.]